MSVTTPTTGQKISDFSAGIVDANSYFIQARNGGTSKVLASQIGQFSNLNLLFNGAGGLDTTNKTIVGAINEINTKTGSDIAVSSSSSETIAEAIEAITPSDTVLSAAWIAQGQTAGDTPLTDYLALTKGFYLVIVAYPVLDTNDSLLSDIIGGNITKWGGSFIQLSSQQNSVRLVRVNADTRIRVNSMQSKTVNFTYLDRGGLFAYKLA